MEIKVRFKNRMSAYVAVGCITREKRGVTVKLEDGPGDRPIVTFFNIDESDKRKILINSEEI